MSSFFERFFGYSRSKEELIQNIKDFNQGSNRFSLQLCKKIIDPQL